MDVKIKLIPAVISLGLLILFAIPLSKGILNLGNGTGMAVSGLLTVIFLLWGRFLQLVSGLWTRLSGRIALCIIGTGAAACAVLAVVISVSMIKEMSDPPKDENTTVVVLGCQVRNGGPSLMLRRRLEAAYGYLSEHEEVAVIVSGGQGDDEAISEAQCMRDWLAERGIAPERIFMEDRSRDTEENLRFSKAIIDENGLPQKITIVTDGFHQKRAEMIAGKQGIKAYNISGKTAWYLLPTYWVREWFGIVHYKLFG